ncbi:UNVERIFIED_CONTAM: hypothetical protein PYX00_006513 [Menopon gallinae]|uniref:Enhancer of mRNA-decapping protein 4 n=1 Tax=Menopon gallinae TaxID=328185 RepID=A0AAW2HW65_9NEOP
MESLENTDSGLSSNNYVPGKLLSQNVKQIVRFTGDDDHHTEVLASSRVTIIPSNGERDKCSSNINLKTHVDYTWEHRYHTGQLLAVHIGGRHIAYGLRAVGQDVGLVRIVNRITNERGLIKVVSGLVQDIAFAHLENQIWLAIVDERGSLFVYTVEEDKSKKGLTCHLMLQVTHDVKAEPGCSHRIIWVPYMPDETEIDTKEYSDNAKLLVLTIGNKAELWHVSAVIARYGAGPHKAEDLEEGLLVIEEHKKSIVDATFSPEGTALATVSLDGTIKFFQVYMQQRQTPRCLHNWRPHDGKPLSSIFFLDNHKAHNPDSQFWKFVITGAENNTELKVWSCVDWSCLQTIKFSPDYMSKKSRMYLKAGLDFGARHLVLSDIYNQVIYVLRIHVDEKETTAFITSASEFVLPFSVLTFGIVDAGTKHCRANSFGIDQEDECDDPEDEDLQEAVVVLMYLVQPKSLQGCCIRFVPPSVDSPPLPLSTFISDSLEQSAKKDGDSNTPANQIYENLSSNPYKNLNLMTPEEFSTSPAKKDVEEFNSKENSSEINQDVFPSFPREVLVSGGSSPSREVQEILSLQGSSSTREVQELINIQPPKGPYFSGGDIPEIDVDVKGKETTPLKDMDVIKATVQSSNGWPHIPLLPESLKPNEDLTARISKRTSLDNAESRTDAIPETSPWKSNQKIEVALSAILASVQQQEAEIKELRQEMSLLRSRQSETVIASLFKSALEKHNLILEEQLSMRDGKERDRQESFLSALTQSVGNLVTTKLDEIVSTEMKKNILPAVINDFNQLKHQLHVEMSQKLSTTDHLLKENISKLVNSKSVMEVLSLSLVSSFRPSVSDICKDVFTQIVIPRCEKALDRIFIQVHDTFTQGTTEYFMQLQKELEKMRQQIMKGSEMIADYENSTREARDKIFAAAQQELQINIQKSLSSIQDNINRKLCETVKESISKEFQSHKTLIEDSVLSAVRSRAVTPASHVVDQIQIMQVQIAHLVNSGQINAAFEQALSASDLSLVVYLCERLNPEQLFKQMPCPLQQAVLLSLIQQLSADMMNHTDLKYRYLEEAVMNLDPNNPMTKEHFPTVLTALQKQLHLYLTSSPGSNHTRNIRKLMMLTQSLLPNSK